MKIRKPTIEDLIIKNNESAELSIWQCQKTDSALKVKFIFSVIHSQLGFGHKICCICKAINHEHIFTIDNSVPVVNVDNKMEYFKKSIISDITEKLELLGFEFLENPMDKALKKELVDKSFDKYKDVYTSLTKED